MNPVLVLIIGGVLVATIIGGLAIILPLQERGIIQSGHSFFSRERELSPSFLPPELQKLETKTVETFWNVVGHGNMDDVFGRFMCAVNLIDTEKQFEKHPAEISDLQDGMVSQGEDVFSITPLQSMEGIEDGMAYLTGLRIFRSNIVHYKILYEYQRKNGSLTYWLFDKKPLLTMPELMRCLPDEERGSFVKTCQEWAKADVPPAQLTL